MDDFLMALTGMRSRVSDRALMDLADLQVMIGHRLPTQLSLEELQERWGICKDYVSTRMSHLRKLGLVVYDRGYVGNPGYWVWRLGPDPGV